MPIRPIHVIRPGVRPRPRPRPRPIRLPKIKLPKIDFYTANCKFRYYTTLATFLGDTALQYGHLIAKFAQGQEASEGDTAYQWTHILICHKAATIADPWPSAPTSTGKGVIIAKLSDDVSGDQTLATGGHPRYSIIAVERFNRNRVDEYLRAFIRRELNQE